MTTTQTPEAANDGMHTPEKHTASGPFSLSSHDQDDTHPQAAAEGTTSAQAIRVASPKVSTPERTTIPAPAILQATSTDAMPGQGQAWNGLAAIGSANPKFATLADPFLRLAADVLTDAEANRIANENRLRFLTRCEEDADGAVRGLGLDERHPDVARLAGLVQLLRDVEHQADLNLQRLMRRHPLGPWLKAQKGVGDRQAARLLAIIGDPYLNLASMQPRTVSALWSYCGHGDPARRRHKGMSQADLFALGSPEAKKRVWGIATSCLKAQGHYADIYYTRKAETEGREHPEACVRCGPSGRPAQPGSPWSDAHRHADALRIVGKEFLRDLWREAKQLHEAGEVA